MKLSTRFRSRLSFVTSFLILGILDLLAGHPLPAHRSPAERRQANIVMLKFQDAVAAERWADALSLCSDRLRNAAATWPSAKDFFSHTLPIENVLAQDFACWSCSTNFYGMFVTLSEAGSEPRIDWYWGLAPTARGWVVDYPPSNLDEYVQKRRAAIHERDERIKKIRQSLEPKVRVVKTRLTAINDHFVVDAPMLFRLELINSGQTSVHYLNQGVQFKPLSVMTEGKEAVRYISKPMQIGIGRGEVSANSSVVVADKIDINQGHEITKPGKYIVQFDSDDLQIGQPMPMEETGRFGENLRASIFDFLPATNRIVSNVLEIQVEP